MTPADTPPKTEPSRRSHGAKASQTDSEARAIIDSEERQRRIKTERLRQARIAQQATETPAPPKAKPKRKAAVKA